MGRMSRLQALWPACWLLSLVLLGSAPCLAQVSEMTPEMAEKFSKGVAALREGNPAVAEQIFRELLADGSTLPQLHHNLGIACQQLRRHDEAVVEFRQALQVAPEFHPARALLGSSLLATGRLDEAVRELRRAVEALPGDLLIRRELGRALSAQGDSLGALHQYQELARLGPDDPESAYLLGEAYLAVAEWSYSRLAGAAGESPRLYQGLAQNQAAVGNLEGAVDSLRKAIKLGPNLPDLNLLLATVYLRQGNKAEALAAVKRELELVPENRGAQQLRQVLEQP